MLDALPPDPPRETIIVTARALPDPAAQRAYSVESIDTPMLRNAPSSRLEQILRQVPGLQLFRRSDARSGHPTGQGVTLRALGGNASSRALLLLDGVPQSDPFGGWINWPAYDPASLAQVRVIRGGGSVANGPGALAGVIAMDSRFESALEAAAHAGSREALEARVFAGQEIGSSLLSLSARAAGGDGFIPITEDDRGPADRPARWREAGLRALWSVPLNASLEAQASLSAFTDRRERGLAFTGNRTDGLDGSLRLVGSGRWSWSGTLYAQGRHFESSFASIDDDRAIARRVALQDEVPSTAVGGSVEVRPPVATSLELRLGADFRLANGESRELYFFVDGEPTRRRRAGGDTTTAGAFAELTGRFGALTMSGGARLDHWRVGSGTLEEAELASGESLRDEVYPARSGWLPTGRAAALFDAGDGLRLRSAAYVGWRMPTLNELFRPFRVGPDATAANPLLDPEQLAGIEAGANYRRSSARLSLTLFANRLHNGIANVTLAQGPGTFPGVGFVGAGGEYNQRRNLDAIVTRGVEVGGEIGSGPWSLQAGASLVDAEVSTDGPAAALDGLRPAQTPRFTAAATALWEQGRRSASLTLRHEGARFEDDLNQRRLAPATTIDGRLAWPLSPRMQLVLRGENLLDELVVAGIGSDGLVERATPRTLWLGLRFSRGSN